MLAGIGDALMKSPELILILLALITKLAGVW
jgi:hypothetical protein